ncbi:ethylbenzene dehydrogenase-related protein [Halomicrobium salinisoli]|uniref:ethylbenzene dehydrogenase-related protein n=1 Tax=Halomicrobium salinisoli TaxID=2878391 RepID=UPI001CF00AC7|nr:ethylbenzene dehydrogenase-related protein [Halomicrobium salinisoli]
MTAGRDDRSVATAAVALALLTAAAVAPALVGARPANEVPVTDLPEAGDSLSNPTADAWGQTPEKEVALASAPSGAPNANDTSIEAVSVRAARTDGRLALRLRWADPTRDANLTPGRYTTPHVNSFGDAAAIQLPTDASANPGIAMGSTQTPVNVWYWSGPTAGQELIAGGPGTSSMVNQQVSTNATYRDDHWYVTFVRNETVDTANRTDFAANEDVQVAFAVWNGSNAERAGQKAVSEWQYFPFGPGPQGPPYEAILWGVAGLALVVVIVATVIGIRRS